MVFSEINISDKPVFDSYLQQHIPETSDLTFTNMFMWRKYYRFRYSIISGFLCIIADPRGSSPFALIPLGKIYGRNFTDALMEIDKYFKQRDWPLVFKRISERELEYFKQWSHREFSVVYDRDNSDYLYNSNDLINLKGKKYDGKRNHINKFKKNHSFEYVEYSAGLFEECVRIMKDWCADKNCKCVRGEYCERYANTELLKNFDIMGCKGALIKVDGRFEAFTVGEMLNSDTAVIHIEKAGRSIDGLYTIVNQQFCEHEWYDALYINREQDLGIEGLRKAKLSYNPVRLIEKYNVHLNIS